MTWTFTENIFGIYKKYWQKNQDQGPTPCPRGWEARLPPYVRPQSRGPPDAPPTSTPTPYIHFRGEKKQGEGFSVFYDTEPPPSPKLSREGWSGVRWSGFYMHYCWSDKRAHTALSSPVYWMLCRFQLSPMHVHYYYYPHRSVVQVKGNYDDIWWTDWAEKSWYELDLSCFCKYD